MPDFPIRTARLLLRPFEEGDFDDLHAYRSNPEVCRYLFSAPATPEETAKRLEKSLTLREAEEEGQWLVLAVCLGDRVIGDVFLKYLSEANRTGEIGYVFNTEFHGHGYAHEAASEVLRIAFEERRLHRVRAECDARNEPSRLLMERLGMRREAHFRKDMMVKGEWADSFVYAMLAEEHQAQK